MEKFKSATVVILNSGLLRMFYDCSVMHSVCFIALRFVVSQEVTGNCLVRLVTNLVQHVLITVILRLHSR